MLMLIEISFHRPMKETSITTNDGDDDDADRSFFPKPAKETSIIAYDDEGDDSRSFFHRSVKGTSII